MAKKRRKNSVGLIGFFFVFMRKLLKAEDVRRNRNSRRL
jgi:hypothetical protein